MPLLILELIPLIIGFLVRMILMKIAIFMTVIAAWYVAYSVLVDYINEKVQFLYSHVAVFNHPAWISFASLLPDNLLFCVNLISQAFTLYLFFRIKHFILSKLTFGIMG